MRLPSPFLVAGALALVPTVATAAPNPSISARPLSSTEQAAPLPPGHPHVSDEQTAPLPPGHPHVSDEQTDDDDEAAANPHASVPGMFNPPPDVAQEDPALPAGTILFEAKDPDNNPLPNIPLVLTILHQSVAKGQSKENRPMQADATGHLRLGGLEVGSQVSYWVKAPVREAVFATAPVQLNGRHGMHLLLHVYPVVTAIDAAIVVMQGVVYFEVKDDRIQAEEIVSIFNLGKSAWYPENLVVKLPAGFTALTSQAFMSDQGVDEAPKQGAKIRGTFAPGRHDLDFRWQLPYDGDPEVQMDMGLPPHVAIMRVMAAAGTKTQLEVTGFPEAQRRTDGQGQHVLVTEKQVRRDEPLDRVHVTLRGLITPGEAPKIATLIAALTVLGGLTFAFTTKRKPTGKGGRSALLAELEDLERAHRRGDVGPKTYEKTRRDLVDAVAETL